MQSLGSVLRALRQAAGLTQEELAERAKLGARTVSDLERGVAATARSATATSLADGLGLIGDARQRFLDIAAGRPPQPVQHNPFASAEPPWIPPLLGRGGLSETVTTILSESGVRWLTLTGSGGVGKTSLAIQIARVASKLWPDGAGFVSLENVTSRDAVVPAICHRLGIRDVASQEQITTLADVIGTSRALLIVDNLEHVIDASLDLLPLLQLCPELILLVTSRVPCHVRSEQVVVVPPLDLPQHGDSADDVASAAAVELLLARASMRKAGWRPPPEDLPAVAEICRVLDGVPLALELAAPRLTVLGPQDLLRRLEAGSLGILSGGPRDSPERQRTALQTLRWSHDLLAAEARTLLRRVSVFADGFTIQAVEAVCDADGTIDVLGALEQLLDHHLLRRMSAPERPLALLQTVREFASAELVRAGESDAYRRRHVTYYAELLTGAAEGILASEPSWFRLLAREHDNVLAAVAAAVDLGDAEAAARLAGEAAEYWFECGHLDLALRALQQALDMDPPGPPGPRAFAAFQAGHVARELGRLDVSRETFALARALYEAEGDRLRVGYCLSGLGGVAWSLDDLDGAVEAFSAAVRIAEEFGLEERWVAWTSNLVHAVMLTDPEQAHGLAAECVRRSGSSVPRLRANAFNVLGLTLARLDRHPEALEAFRSAGSLALETGDQGVSAVRYLDYMGVSLLALGERRQAALMFGAAATQWARHGLAPSVLDLANHAVRDELMTDADDGVRSAWTTGSETSLTELPRLFA